MKRLYQVDWYGAVQEFRRLGANRIPTSRRSFPWPRSGDVFTTIKTSVPLPPGGRAFAQPGDYIQWLACR